MDFVSSHNFQYLWKEGNGSLSSIKVKYYVIAEIITPTMFSLTHVYYLIFLYLTKELFFLQNPVNLSVVAKKSLNACVIII